MSPNEHPDIAADLRRGIHHLAISTVLIVILLITVAGVGFVSNRITADSVRSEAARSTHALCALRVNVNDRIITSQEFLIKHPMGVIGIPAASIQSSITKDKKALKALSNLKCS